MARIKITAGSTAGGTARAATHYGARHANEGGTSKYQISQNVQKLEIKFDHLQVNADEVKQNVDALYQSLPAGASIKSAALIVHTRFTSADSPTLQPRLVDANGITPDADGLHQVAIPSAALIAGQVVPADGAQSNGDKITSALYLDINSTGGTWASGEATYVIEYEVHDFL